MSNHTNRSANVKNVKTLIKLGSGLTFIKYLPMKIFVVLLHIKNPISIKILKLWAFYLFSYLLKAETFVQYFLSIVLALRAVSFFISFIA